MSEAVPKDRIRTFDKNGKPLIEFNAAVDRSWAINEEGRAQFKLPTRLSWVNETNFRYGNWLLVENSLLPPWVGLIDVPRQSNATEMTVSAYTPEHLFSQRIAPIDEIIRLDAGGWFEYFIRFTNNVHPTLLRFGSIHKDGAMIQKTVCPRYLSEYLQDIVEESLQEYEFVPSIVNGGLTVRGNWSMRLGVDTQMQLISPGGNVEADTTQVTDDGPLANDVFVFGDGATWFSRPYAKAWDQKSIAIYGLRHYVEEIQGVTDVPTLQRIADARLDRLKQGAKVLSLSALNVGDTFQYLRLGNRLKVRLTTTDFGYQGQARIIGMNYEPLTPNKVELVLEEEL